MAASSSDKFLKGARKWVGQIGAGGVNDAVAATIPLSSATNLPTDTGVVAVIDRVDSSGKKTPTLEETVIGVVSGSNLATCTRGAEGTAQAHTAGAVVEILITNLAWGKIIDGILVEHAQDGTHAATIVKTTGAQTLTGKRIAKRVVNTTQSATPVINTDVTDVSHIVGLAQAITSMTSSLTGTPVAGDTLRIDITDDGTARQITWGDSFESSGTVTLPTTTVLGVRLDVGFLWNSVTSKWRCVATA